MQPYSQAVKTNFTSTPWKTIQNGKRTSLSKYMDYRASTFVLWWWRMPKRHRILQTFGRWFRLSTFGTFAPPGLFSIHNRHETKVSIWPHLDSDRTSLLKCTPFLWTYSSCTVGGSVIREWCGRQELCSPTKRGTRKRWAGSIHAYLHKFIIPLSKPPSLFCNMKWKLSK